MSIIIVLILVLAIGYLGLRDKKGERKYQRETEERKSISDDFNRKFVDKRLEESISIAFENEESATAIKEEVHQALKHINSWNGYSLTLTRSDCARLKGWKQKQAERKLNGDRELALNIMLANRGKVSSRSATHGYETYFILDGHSKAKLQQFELVEWITNTLEKQGVHVTPIYKFAYGTSVYGWLGSFAVPNDKPMDTIRYEIKPFVRALIEQPVVDIPKPYYKR